PNAYHFSQYAMEFAEFSGNGYIGHITVRNCELGPSKGGGGVFYTRWVYAFTFEYNYVHDNHTHGWSSPLTFLDPLGHGAGEGTNTVRGNFVAYNTDVPQPFCIAKYCVGGTTDMCDDSVHGFGDLCPCFDNVNCQSG